MSDKHMDAIDEASEDLEGGGVYLLKWIGEAWGEAAQGVLTQFLVFYGLMLIGFLCLYIMMRSTTQLRELRRNIAESLREQRDRKFDGGNALSYNL